LSREKRSLKISSAASFDKTKNEPPLMLDLASSPAIVARLTSLTLTKASFNPKETSSDAEIFVFKYGSADLAIE
jgi:hypothetical protein